MVEPAIKQKPTLVKEFDELSLFYPSGKYVVVQANDTNPCQDGIAAFHGCVQRSDGILKSLVGRGWLIKSDFH